MIEQNTEKMRFNSLDEWLDWQEDLHYKTIDLGIERCKEVAERMDLLAHEFHVISIAGTNGKGSSAAMLDMIYRNAGYTVGTYTSPHLLRYNERVKINGLEASDQFLCEAFNRVDQARGDISLTYFEFGTLAALDLFRNSGIQLAILEVGLGGRLDAVNMLDAEVALICSIDLDHEKWLGNTRNLIGYEKAGIMRAGRPAVCSDSEIPESIIDYAYEIGANFYQFGPDFRIEINENDWDWHSNNRTIYGLPKTGLSNNSFIQNAAGVLMVVDLLIEKFPVDQPTLKAGFEQVSLPGRFQVYEAEVPIILDVAHNRQAAEVLAKNLADHETRGDTHMIIGMLKDKNHQMVIEALSMVVDHWYVVSLEHDRGTEGQVLIDILEKIGITNIAGKFATIDAALESACTQTHVGDRVVVTGSFLTVGAAIKWLNIKY